MKIIHCITVVAASSVLLVSCCRKKFCPGFDLPSIPVVFKSHTPGKSVNTVIYELENNRVIDSTFLFTERVTELRPFDDYEDLTASTFVIRRALKRDTVSDVRCYFFREEIFCNRCFLKNDYDVVWKYSDFSFRNKTSTYSIGDTLYLD